MILKESFVDIFSQILNKHYNDNHIARKRNEIEYFKHIINLLYSCPYWSRYNGSINGKLLHKKHTEYVKKGLYNQLFTEVLHRYIFKNKYYIYKFLSTDTCFIPNKCGIKLSRNRFYKSKKGLKISTINDVNGIPLSIIIKNGNIHDSKIFIETYHNMKVNTEAYKYKKSNKHKQYVLADKGYDSGDIKKFLEKEGYDYIIPQNKRNIKDPNKIIELTLYQEKLYKKRMIVENFYSWLKQYTKITHVYEKNIIHYFNLVLLASSNIIFNRIS
jgi:transposase